VAMDDFDAHDKDRFGELDISINVLNYNTRVMSGL